MNRFVFITHVTPVAKRNALRQQLFELYATALQNQTYTDWFVIQLHEGPDETEGKFHRFHLPDAGREEKFQALTALFRRDDFTSLIRSADYVIKLDDDDLISPTILQALSTFSDDLYYDAYHTFYDISSGTLTQQQRAWVASTCVHKTEHALSEWKGEGASPVGNLLYTDHSKTWHRYYAEKTAVKADALHPVYARVLSPTSITSGGTALVKTIADVDMQKYYAYLRSFGEWNPAVTRDFDQYRRSLGEAWKLFSGRQQQSLPAKSAGERLRATLRGIKNRIKGK